MRKINRVISFAALLFCGACTAPTATIDITVENNNPKSTLALKLLSDDKTIDITLDESGKSTISLTDFSAQYATLKLDWLEQTLYLQPSDELAIDLNAAHGLDSIKFSGSAAQVNQYLDSNFAEIKIYKEAGLEEAAFIAKCDSVYNVNVATAEAAEIPSKLRELEKKRLYYATYFNIGLYPTYHSYSTDPNYTPSESFNKRLEEQFIVDGDLLAIPKYYNLIECTALAIVGDHLTKPNETVKFFDEQIKDDRVAAALTQNFVLQYIDRQGIEDCDYMLEVFKRRATDEKIIAEVDGLCELWGKIAPGQPSPTFSYLDIDGNTVSLDDLKGKFVYIDLWATWCGPCRGELPYLMELEHKYAGKEIHFVSISCDQDKAAWEKMVKGGKMGGIQLHNGGDRTFMDSYAASGIPRFILLGRNSEIIDANMSRPSEEATAAKFDELLKL